MSEYSFTNSLPKGASDANKNKKKALFTEFNQTHIQILALPIMWSWADYLASLNLISLKNQQDSS